MILGSGEKAVEGGTKVKRGDKPMASARVAARREEQWGEVRGRERGRVLGEAAACPSKAAVTLDTVYMLLRDGPGCVGAPGRCTAC